ncbi:MAG: PhzF family phenazine biosynthesis protein [bacterium]
MTTRQDKDVRTARFPFETVDVFTDQRFGGNPLAVFPAAEGISSADMQRLAHELNLSETTFVLPPADPANTACVRIFNRTAEMPFAGHPNVGTAFVLAHRFPSLGDAMRFEEKAGLVDVQLTRDDDGTVSGATVRAPQPLTVGVEIPVQDVAACVGLSVGDIMTSTHHPHVASVGNPYVIAEVTYAALARAAPNIEAFRRALARHPEFNGRYSVHLYARNGDKLHARMFAPLAGTFEDPATGSANAPLGAMLLSLAGGARAEYEIVQGVEMGRPSRLYITAWHEEGAYRAAIRGRCVPVLSGTALV